MIIELIVDVMMEVSWIVGILSFLNPGVHHLCRRVSESKLIVNMWSHMYRLRHFNSWISGRKGKFEKLVKIG